MSALTDYTVNELGSEIHDRINALRNKPYGGEVQRDLALARTHLEDALTRFNSAQYRIKGLWERRDPEAP